LRIRTFFSGADGTRTRVNTDTYDDLAIISEGDTPPKVTDLELSARDLVGVITDHGLRDHADIWPNFEAAIETAAWIALGRGLLRVGE
jgi:hypothetical protein